MKLDEVKDMLPQKPERLETVEEPKRQELVNACAILVNFGAERRAQKP